MNAAAKNPAGNSAELTKLQRRIKAVRRKHLSVTLAHGIALVSGAVVAWLTAEMAFDWLIELPWIVRAILLSAGLCGTSFLAWKHIVFPLSHRPNDEAVALMVERAMPAFCSRFIASIQLAGAEQRGASPVLVRALLAETGAMAARLNFHWVVKTENLRRILKISAGVVAAALALFVFSGRAGVPLLKRAFLSTTPLPRKTLIVGVTGNLTVGIGDDVKIEAATGGIIPSSGKVIVKYATGQAHEFAMEANPNSLGKFSLTIQSVQEPFSYVVRLNDATTTPFQIATLSKPMVASIECEQVYPAYTRLGSVKRDLGALTLLAGSQLKLKITASSNIQKAVLRSVGVEKQTPLRIDEKNRRELTGALEIPAKGLTGFSIDLVDDRGVVGNGTAVYRIDIVPDLPPTIKITQPERHEELVTRQGKLMVGFQADDDFGISKVALRYKTGQEEGSPVKTIGFNLGNQQSKTASNRFEWKIGAIDPRPTEGTVIEYWLEATDTNTATGPGVTATEHYQVKVVSESEKRADLANRLTDAMNALQGVSEGQEDVTHSLQPLIFERPGQNK